ncbi:MAG: J domain-containing protein, partial [Chloroflexota bacterium]|nr:J domain-containing protein [Chloroflexota bacterium]
MASGADPLRVLGLAPGASQAEIKRAYRRLAKAFHPDAAGEAAIPRFLAIQAAYDQLIGETGAAGMSGPRSAAGAAGPAGSARSARPPGWWA